MIIEIKNNYDLVKYCLVEYPETRDNINLLYVKACEVLEPGISSATFYDLIVNQKKYNIPKYETITRSRRFVVEDFPELKGCDEVERHRTIKQLAFEEAAEEHKRNKCRRNK